MPMIHSSDVLWMFFGLAIAISFAGGMITRSSYSLGPIGLFRGVAPCLRGMTIIAITAIGFARINTYFFDLDASPAASLADRILEIEQLASLSTQSVHAWLSYFLMSTFVLVDLSLALLLLMPSLRRFAIGWGGVYYFGQAILQIGESRWLFPVLLFGLLTFASPTLMNRIVQALTEARRRICSYAFFWFACLLAVLAVAIGCWFAWNQPHAEELNHYWTSIGATTAFSKRSSLLETIYLLTMATSLTLILGCLVEARPRRTRVSLLPRNVLHYGLILSLLLLVASPYVGLGTSGRFCVASGLRKSGGSRHLLIPSVDLVGSPKEMSSAQRWVYRKLFAFHP